MCHMTHSKRCASFSLSSCISIWPNFEGGVHPIIWLVFTGGCMSLSRKSMWFQETCFPNRLSLQAVSRFPNCCKLIHHRIICKVNAMWHCWIMSSLVCSCLLSPIQSIQLSSSTAESRNLHQHQSSLLSQEMVVKYEVTNAHNQCCRCGACTIPSLWHWIFLIGQGITSVHSLLPSSLRGLFHRSNMHSCPILCQTRKGYLSLKHPELTQ